MPDLTRYRSDVEDSARWEAIDLRPGDIIISAPSKSGLTWTQMICALLVFQTPELPAPLTAMSPWVDMLINPIDGLRKRLDQQQHRRFLKTHTPLDGVPDAPGVTRIAVARDPRDVVVSLHHQGSNLDRVAISRLLGQPEPSPGGAGRERRSERDTFLRWLSNDTPPVELLDTLRGLAWQQSVAWEHRHDPDVVLLHYDDLARDLEREMRRLADHLGIEVAPTTWPALVKAATFTQMQARAEALAPHEQQGILKDSTRFFRAGTSGQWHAWLTAQDRVAYAQRVSDLMADDLAQWLHRNHPL